MARMFVIRFLILFVILSGCSDLTLVSTAVGPTLDFSQSYPELEPAWEPVALTYDSQGTLFFVDKKHRVFKVSPGGQVKLLAGSTQSGFRDGQGRDAQFNQPLDLIAADDGTLFIADSNNHAIRAISPSGFVSTLAGGHQGFVNGRGEKAFFNQPNGLALVEGVLYVAELRNHSIRAVTQEGVVHTYLDIQSPFSIVASPTNDLYISTSKGVVKVEDKQKTYLTHDHSLFADLVFHTDNYLIAIDSYQHRLLKITADGIVHPLTKNTRAGQRDGTFNEARFHFPRSLALSPDGLLMVADSNQSKIRQVSLNPSKVAITFVKSAPPDFASNSGVSKHLSAPRGISFDSRGNLYIADYWNHRILKKLTSGQIEIVAEKELRLHPLNLPADIAIDRQGVLYISDSAHHQIRQIFPDGQHKVLAGNGKRGFRNGQGEQASFNLPLGVSLDQMGNLYVADTGNHCIRKVFPDGQVMTLSGTGQAGFADGSPAIAQFHYPTDVAIDLEHQVYVTDFYNHRIRKINFNGQVSTIAGGEPGLLDASVKIAKFYAPQGIAIDRFNQIYVSDSWNHRIRKITPTGQVSSIAGLGRDFVFGGAFSDGSRAQFNKPGGLAIGPDGLLYVADTGNNRVRQISIR